MGKANLGSGARLLSIVLFLTSMVFAQVAIPEPDSPSDYRARTIYFLLTDRFHPHQPYSPYVDPEFPNATNSIDCFVSPVRKKSNFVNIGAAIFKA